MREDLKKLGLTDNEIKVYLSLLSVGETPVGGIINDLKIHRQIAYNALDSLEQKNMVIKNMKNKVHHYRVSDPELILENIKKQELIASRLQKTIKQEMKKNRREHEVSVYNGLEQVKSFLLSGLKNGPDNGTMKGLYTLGLDYEKTIGSTYLNKFEKIRIKKNIFTKHITSESAREDIKKTITKLTPSTRKCRFLTHDAPNPISTIIWDNAIYFQSFHSEIPFIIEIKNNRFFKTFDDHFEALWKIANK